MDENLQAQQPTIDSNSGTSCMERRPPLGEDPAAMTIEFLRARLLSERSVSKAARQHAEQLAKKVLELEHLLDSEIRLREKFESARLEALSKYKDELISDYGHLFVSNSGKDDSDRTTGDPNKGCSATEASGSRCNDVDDSLGHGRTGGESALPPSDLEDEEPSSMGRMASFEVGLEVGDLRQGSYEEARNKGSSNDDDEEIELMGREKGILAWGRRKGNRRQQDKERGQNTELFGRTISQKSFMGLSPDGESPHKRWTGKSVRQIRKKETRLPDTNSEDGPCQIQDSEDVEGKSSHQEAIKEGLQCDGEGDTEVERVLERQAELIERFEAEESAQMAWEEKFRQQTPSSLSDSSGQDSPPNTSMKVENNIASHRDEQRAKEEALCKQGAGGLAGADDNISNHLIGDVVSQQLQKVHLEDSLCKNTEAAEEKFSSLQSVHKAASEDSIRVDNGGKDLVIGATNEASIVSDSLQGHEGSLVIGMAALLYNKSQEERQPGTSEQPESNSSSEVPAVMVSEMDPPDKLANLSHNQALPTADTESIQNAHSDVKESQDLIQMLSREVSESQANSLNTDIQGGEMHVRGTSDRHAAIGSPYLCNEEKSSFKFSSCEHVNMLGDDVASSSHQIPDLPPRGISQGDFSFGLMMPNSVTESISVNELRDQGQERTSGSGETVDCSASEFDPKAVVGSCDEQTSQILRAASNQQGLNNCHPATSAKINIMREDTAVDTEALVDTQEEITQSSWGGENGLTDGNSSHASSDHLMKDSPWEYIFKRRMRAQDTGQDQVGKTKNVYYLPPYPDLRNQQPLYASTKREGINLDNSPPLGPSRIAMPDYSGPGGYGASSYVYQDTASRIFPRKSVDGGFDRVTEVLRVLQIAKHQIQSADQPAELVGDLDTAHKIGNPNSYRGSSQTNLDSPTSYSASPRDCPPAGYLSPPRFHVDSPYPASFQVPSHFAVPGRVPYYSSLHGRGLKPFIPDLGGGAAEGYAGSPSQMQHSIPWLPQGARIRKVYPHDARNHR